jgi:hypothetical protein
MDVAFQEKNIRMKPNAQHKTTLKHIIEKYKK